MTKDAFTTMVDMRMPSCHPELIIFSCMLRKSFLAQMNSQRAKYLWFQSFKI